METFDEAIARVVVEYRARESERDAKTSELGVALTDLATARAANVILQSDLEACRNPAPPVPLTVFGAYCQPQGRSAFDAFNAKLGGKRIGVTRQFYGSGSSLGIMMPVPGTATIGSLHSRNFSTGNRPLHNQVAGGVIDLVVTAFANKVKSYLGANPSEVFLMSFVAEPDVHMNADLGPPADHVAAYLRVRSKFDAIVKVPWGLILTGTTFTPGNPDGRDPAWWWHDSYDFVGVDPYNMAPPTATWTDMRGQSEVAAAFAESKGVPLDVPEYGSQFDPTRTTRQGEWVKASGALFRELGVRYACYFDADKTADEAKDFRISTHPESMAAFGGLLP